MPIWLKPHVADLLQPGETLIYSTFSSDPTGLYLMLAFWPLFLLFQFAAYVRARFRRLPPGSTGYP